MARFTLQAAPVKLEGRAAAEWQDAAPMAEAHGGERTPDGHNPEVVPPA
jgi:hypothetical protein